MGFAVVLSGDHGVVVHAVTCLVLSLHRRRRAEGQRQALPRRRCAGGGAGRDRGACAEGGLADHATRCARAAISEGACRGRRCLGRRSEEHTSELQSLMRISYAVFCLKKKKRIVKSVSGARINKNIKTKNTYENTVKAG